MIRQFNDGFIAELGQSTWTTSGSQIIAPDNFAHPLDAPEEVVSVNTIGVGWSAGEAADLAYAGGTVPLTASTPVDPGPQRLYLSIFDQGDGMFDSAVASATVAGRARASRCWTSRCSPTVRPPSAVKPSR